MKVIIVTEIASMQRAGEPSLAFYYFKLLRSRHVDVWMVCHALVREELRKAFPDEEFQKIHFIELTWLQKKLWQITPLLPPRIRGPILGQVSHLLTQRQARTVAKNLIDQLGIQIVFEPAPIQPKGLSCMYKMGVPVAIGPMCGGINFPPAFRYMDSRLTRTLVSGTRFLSLIMHWLVPGKLQADTLIVANETTANALPKGCKGKIYEVVESGVDLSIWKQTKHSKPLSNESVRFVYCGRFADWKGVQFLVEAFKQVAERTNSVLELIGDGVLRDSIETQVEALNLQNSVNFHGWMTREASAKLIADCDVFVMPSLRECGGTALLEAMAMGLPIITTNWAGPANYVDSTCGILVEPTSSEAFINGLVMAMIQLAESAELRLQMGEASMQRITKNYFDWESKTDRVLEILKETLALHNQKMV